MPVKQKKESSSSSILGSVPNVFTVYIDITCC